jgi:dihydroflavonol-4-reductase
VAAEGWARVSRREPRVTLDGVRMSTKHMYFSSRKAERELGYRWRDPRLAIAAAIEWFKENEYF